METLLVVNLAVKSASSQVAYLDVMMGAESVDCLDEILVEWLVF